MTTEGPDSSRPCLLAVIFLFKCIRLGVTVAGPETCWSTHPARPYSPLLKTKALRIKGLASTVLNGLAMCGAVAVPALPHCLCVLGEVIVARSVFRRSVEILGVNCFKNCEVQYKYRM